jgi:hypothetical protein
MSPYSLHSELRAIIGLSLFPHLQFAVTYISDFSLLHSPLVVSWQRIHNSLSLQITHEIFFSQSKSFLAISSQSASTADSLNSLLQLPTPELDSILILSAWDPRYIASGRYTESTASSTVACWFTTAEICLPHSCVATRAARIHRERSLQQLFNCCVTSERTRRIPLLHV